MSKRFIYFLIVLQAVITLAHFLAYQLLILFFPGLTPSHTLLLTILLLLSSSFLGFLLITRKIHNKFLNACNILAGIWMIFSFYFLFASIPALLLYLLTVISLTVAGWLAFLISAGLVIYGVINARIIRLTEIRVKLPNLPAWWKNKTAVMVSDLHLGQILNNGFAKKIAMLINRQKPEIVFIPGDFYDGAYSDFQSLANEFSAGKNISAPLGVYFCSGNHELFAGYQECEQALKNAGIKILENEKIEINGLQIAGAAYTTELMEGLRQTLASLNIDPNKPSILLKHVPNQTKEVAEAGVSLMLSGHSHHGQIWPGPLITKKIWKGFDYGLKTLNNLQVYTSSGAGTWGPPMRIFTKAEIVKIIFE